MISDGMMLLKGVESLYEHAWCFKYQDVKLKTVKKLCVKQ